MAEPLIRQYNKHMIIINTLEMNVLLSRRRNPNVPQKPREKKRTICAGKTGEMLRPRQLYKVTSPDVENLL